MILEQDGSSPGYRNQAYRAMEKAWRMMADIAGGTVAIRQRGREYLPIEPAEDFREYDSRLERAVFFNATERTLHAFVGMVFRKEPRLSRDNPQPLVDLWENIDNAGTHGAVFSKELFTSILRYGHGLIYVDMPPPLPPGATLADERAANRRPYWVYYEAPQIINWRYETKDGQPQLTLLVLMEETDEPDGDFGQKKVVRYRVLRPGSWELYREDKDQFGKRTYAIEDSGTITLPFIPVAAAYSRKTGVLTSHPFLQDLALLNITHYQKYSDYSTYLHIASRPVLWFRGRNQARPLEPIGPYTFFDVDQDNGHVDFAETTGSALDAARTDLKDLTAHMATLGLALIARPAAYETTATEQIITKVQADSDLVTAARSLKDAIELALQYTSMYLELEESGSLEIESITDKLFVDPQEIQAYSSMVENGQLSLESLWAILSRAGRLPEDFDTDKERIRIVQDRELLIGDVEDISEDVSEDDLEDKMEDEEDDLEDEMEGESEDDDDLDEEDVTDISTYCISSEALVLRPRAAKAEGSISFTPTEGMVREAKMGLEWRSEFGRGGTMVGVARARDISNRKQLSASTAKRMYSFFSRHEVDKKAQGFRPGEKGYPSNGRIAWALWGGDAGFAWARKKVKQIESREKRD